MEVSPRRLLGIGVAIAALVAVLVVMSRSRSSPDLVLAIGPATPAPEIVVYVGGAVRSPGIYRLPSGARLADALQAAGLAAGVDTSALALGRALADGEVIEVPRAAGAGRSPTPGRDGASAATPRPSVKIDINTASAAELERLPGIGPALAARIVEYREAHGPFAALDDLARVRGISPRMVDAIRPLATVGG